MKLFLTPLLVAFLLSCGGKEPASKVLEAPTGLRTEKLSTTSLRLSWNYEGSSAEGFYVFVNEPASSYYSPEPAATLPSSARSYTFEGLKEGTLYRLGVQAFGSGESMSPLVYADFVETDVTVVPEKDDDNASEQYIKISAISATEAGIAVTYAITGLPTSNMERGLCLSTEHNPTVDDMVFPGPTGTGGTQYISSAALEYGTEYRVRAYVSSGSKVYYTSTSRISLGDEPAALTFNWTEVTGLDLPSAIKVYRTSDKLEGRAFNAWYAVADCSGSDVEFRVLNPSGTATIDKQAEDAGDCYILINGGIFGTKHIGPVVADGSLSSWRDEADAQYWGSDKKLHYVTRSVFGVDASGKPAAYYSFYEKEGVIRYYERPLATVSGEPLYKAPDSALPCAPVSWTPRQAISTGPMVLFGGNVTADLSKTSGGAWLNNFELWADDIFTGHPDRTAVGYTADGKIVLFICDGRIAESDGAYLSEVGRIMKGLGCIGAINLDGGGSTGMWARGGGHLNSLKTGSGTEEKNRPVMTTLGFFKKR